MNSLPHGAFYRGATLTFLTLLVSFTCATAQVNPSLKKLNVSTKESLVRLKTAADHSHNLEYTRRVASLDRSVSALFRKLADCDTGQINDTTFISSLSAANETINMLAQSMEFSGFESKLDALSRDYTAKATASPAGWKRGVLTRINVEVIAKNGNKSADGYDVRCNYMWDFDAHKARFWSNSPTSNASLKLPPGYYVIWLEKNGAVIKRADVEVVEDKKAKQVVTFHL